MLDGGVGHLAPSRVQPDQEYRAEFLPLIATG